MSRPSRTAGTALPPEGEARMRAEFHELWHVRRPSLKKPYYFW